MYEATVYAVLNHLRMTSESPSTFSVADNGFENVLKDTLEKSSELEKAVQFAL